MILREGAPENVGKIKCFSPFGTDVWESCDNLIHALAAVYSDGRWVGLFSPPCLYIHSVNINENLDHKYNALSDLPVCYDASAKQNDKRRPGG